MRKFLLILIISSLLISNIICQQNLRKLNENTQLENELPVEKPKNVTDKESEQPTDQDNFQTPTDQNQDLSNISGNESGEPTDQDNFQTASNQDQLNSSDFLNDAKQKQMILEYTQKSIETLTASIQNKFTNLQILDNFDIEHYFSEQSKEFKDNILQFNQSEKNKTLKEIGELNDAVSILQIYYMTLIKEVNRN